MKKSTAIAEVILWIWVLGFLGYFYYSHDFIPLLQHFWKQAIG